MEIIELDPYEYDPRLYKTIESYRKSMREVREIHPLYQKSNDVKKIDNSVRGLAQSMFELLYETGGLGLSAVQIGVHWRMFLAKTEANDTECYINPTIVHKKNKVIKQTEGCLSIPGVFIDVARSSKIEVEWYNLDGEYHRGWFSNLDATVLQHEMDHLDGILILDHGLGFKQI